MQALRSLGSIVSLDWDGNLRIDVVATCECVALSSLWYVKWISDLKRRTFVSIKSFHSTKGHIGCKICDITSEKRALLIIFYLYVVHFAICILFHSSFKHLKPPNKCVYHQTSDKILKHSKEQSSLLLTPLATSLCLLLRCWSIVCGLAHRKRGEGGEDVFVLLTPSIHEVACCRLSME